MTSPTMFTIRVKQCRPANDYVLSILGNNLVQAQFKQGDPTQQWNTVYNQYMDGNNAVAGYSLINAASGLAAKFMSDGGPIGMAPYAFGDKTLVWRLDSVGDGFFAINRWDRNEVMDVKGGSCDPGATILSWGWNGGDNQRWELSPATPIIQTATIGQAASASKS